MSIRSLTYRIHSLLEAPKISTDLLWELVLLFAGLGMVYLLLIFRMRNRISARREAVRLQKRELAPMISNFLFYRHDSDEEDRETYIRMKIEIRELLKVPLNREVMTEVLMDLRLDVAGDARERLFRLFQDLGLDADSFRKLESWRWERVSQGILELTEMQVEKAFPFIRKFVNDRRGVIRKQAQLATVMLREEGISYFLDTARYRISEWQQLKLLEILRQREAYIPPRFRAWLTSENRDVVLFALRLIRFYRQNDAERALVTLLRHRNQVVRAAALECIRDFRFHSALEPIKALYPKSGEELKLLILDTLGVIGTETELPFLEKCATRDGNFIVRSKARAVMNHLRPDSALPVVGPESFAGPFEDETGTCETPLSGFDTDSSEGPPSENRPDSEEIHEGGQANLPETADGSDAGFLNGPASGKEIVPTQEHAPTQPEWEEDEAVFDVCFLEELEDILAEMTSGEEPEGVLPLDFLPLVTEAADQTEACPDYLCQLEVVADWIAPLEKDRLSDRMPRTASDADPKPLNPDFLPWVVSGPDFPENPESQPSTERMMSEPANNTPEHFSALWEPLFELDGVSQPAAPLEQEAYFKQPLGQQEDGMGKFSIFREFFREYDTESKLILLEHLAEVGEEKEWEFVRELLQDPEPLIRARASQTLQALGRKLGLEGPRESDMAHTEGNPVMSGDLPGTELNFIPEWEQAFCPKMEKAGRNARKPAGRWMRRVIKRTDKPHG